MSLTLPMIVFHKLSREGGVGRLGKRILLRRTDQRRGAGMDRGQYYATRSSARPPFPAICGASVLACPAQPERQRQGSQSRLQRPTRSL